MAGAAPISFSQPPCKARRQRLSVSSIENPRIGVGPTRYGGLSGPLSLHLRTSKLKSYILAWSTERPTLEHEYVRAEQPPRRLRRRISYKLNQLGCRTKNFFGDSVLSVFCNCLEDHPVAESLPSNTRVVSLFF